MSVHAAFDGTIHAVQAVNDITLRTENWVILRHIDPGDNTVFYTFYDHLQYTGALADLQRIAGPNSPLIDAPFAPQFYTDPITGQLYAINPFATSGETGAVGNPHLHFAGMVGGISAVNNAINPMRDDSLPYNNNHSNNENPPTYGAPTIQNIVLTTNPRRLSFRISTHHEELDLNGITLFDGVDGVQIDFDNRTNTDAAGDPTGNTNEDGIINTTTSYGRQITITITTYNFNPGTNQIMDFAFDLPAAWNLNPITIHVDDTQGLFDQENVFSTGVKDKDVNGDALPLTYHLFQNFPNPFNPSTTIRFALPKRSLVSLTIYDMHGSLVRELATQKFYDSGWGELVWDGTNTTGLPVASGAYFYRLNAESLDNKKSFSQTKKLLLVR